MFRMQLSATLAEKKLRSRHLVGTKMREVYMLRMTFVTNMLKFLEIVRCELGMGSFVKIREDLHKAGVGMRVRRGRTLMG